MKFEVTYHKPKKKGFAKQSAIFYQIEDAMMWEEYVKQKGCKEIQLMVK